MKNFILQKTNLFFFLVLVLLSALTTQAQVAINTTNSPPDASSMLDVSSTNKGVLIPRVTYSSISSLTVQGLLVYVTSGGPNGNGFYFYDGGWKKLLADVPLSVAEGGTGSVGPFPPGTIIFTDPSTGNYFFNTSFVWDNINMRLGVGIPAPATNVHIYENNNDIIPELLVDQNNSTGSTGDASMQYLLAASSSSTYISSGIDNDDSFNFEISNSSAGLTGTSYSDANTMMRIHTQAQAQPPSSDGIVDFNHQSRSRVFLNTEQSIPQGTWTGIEFNQVDYDEHGEFTLTPAPNTPGKFTATEEGYYQVNARTEFGVGDQSGVVGQGYVSIAIFKNGAAYAVGNNLQMTLMGSTGPEEIELLEKNNAPNVSDVLYLAAGDYVEIFVFQSFANPNAVLRVFDSTLPPSNPSQPITYFSIHKIS